ncbi:unnamed protein product [Protopolystoma xenopodis]|uniref:CTLH domain-containing protein n=1 Tax=Protopolystoma xenopodis TaxID=117903 RepID=A0A448WGR1_9PLAT|nr:unnamed protein product [Protopolystoma xenopodis]
MLNSIRSIINDTLYLFCDFFPFYLQHRLMSTSRSTHFEAIMEPSSQTATDQANNSSENAGCLRGSLQGGALSNSLNCFGDQVGLSLTREEINRFILEYLVVEGYKDAAEKFSREIGFDEPLSKIPTAGASLSERMWIREAVLERRIEEVIPKVNRLWPELFDKSPFIYFQLRQLQMLELIRARRLEEALTFAQSYLADPVAKRLSDHPRLLHEMQNTMALLAFEDPTNSIYGSLLSSRHAEKIAGSLNRAILRHIEATCDDSDGLDCRKSEKSTDVAGNVGTASTIPRLTKMMGLLLHFRDIAQFTLPPELSFL